MVGIGLGIGIGKARRGSSGPVYDPAAVDFFARIPTQTPTRYALLNTVFVGLRAAGILSLLDCLWLMAAADSTTARANLISSSFTLTPVASPAFSTDRGYAGDGSSSYLNTNYTPSTAAGKFTLNSGHVSLYDRTSRAAANITLLGSVDGTKDVQIIPLFTGGFTYGRVNDSGGNVPNSNSSGQFIADRTSSASRDTYRNGASLGSVSVAPVGLSTLPIYILGANNGGSLSTPGTDQIASASIGAGLGPTLAAQYYSITQAYMTGVGAQV